MDVLVRFCSILKEEYGLVIKGSLDHISFLKEYYTEKSKDKLDENYNKNFLISEVARLMILKEIMPKPKGKRRKAK